LAGTRSQMVIPVCSTGQTLGLLDLQSPHPHAFFAADEEWLLTVGTLAAVPIDRWRCQQVEQQIGSPEMIPQQQLLLSARLAAAGGAWVRQESAPGERGAGSYGVARRVAGGAGAARTDRAGVSRPVAERDRGDAPDRRAAYHD